MNKVLSIFIFIIISSVSNLALAGDDGKIKVNGKNNNGYIEVRDCFEKVRL